MSNLQRAYEHETELPQRVALHLAPAMPLSEATPPVGDEYDEAESDDVWGVWPYCWAISLYNEASDRFHSFHERLDEQKLARHNERSQQKFRKRFWKEWDRGTEIEGVEMRMV